MFTGSVARGLSALILAACVVGCGGEPAPRIDHRHRDRDHAFDEFLVVGADLIGPNSLEGPVQ